MILVVEVDDYHEIDFISNSIKNLTTVPHEVCLDSDSGKYWGVIASDIESENAVNAVIAHIKANHQNEDDY